MSLYKKMVKPERLENLRKSKKKSKKWSRKQLAENLNRLIGYNGKYNKEGEGLALEGNSGSQVVSHLEKGQRSITPEIALAYAEIFNVSLDYIYGRVDSRSIEYKAITQFTGLSEKAIDALKTLKDEIICQSRKL